MHYHIVRQKHHNGYMTKLSHFYSFHPSNVYKASFYHYHLVKSLSHKENGKKRRSKKPFLQRREKR